MTRKFDETARNTYLSIPKELREEYITYDGTPVREMIVRAIDVKMARLYIATYHYSRTMPDSTKYVYGGYLNSKLAGVICYGMGAGKSQYTTVLPEIEKGEYVELTRLWCPDTMPRNTESKLISESLKLLPPKIKLVLSFSDESKNHFGIIYQACNFLYLGVNGGGSMLIDESGNIKHPRLLGIYKMRHPTTFGKLSNEELMEELHFSFVSGGKKHKYVHIRADKKERKEILKRLQDRILPYPKHQNYKKVES